MTGSPSTSRSAKLIPALAGRSDRPPVGVGPLSHRSERYVEGTAEVGQLIEGGSFDSAGIEMASDESVTLGPAKRVSQHLVGDAVEGVVEVLVSEATARKLSQYRESPTSGE
jgi:hypothetical protein